MRHNAPADSPERRADCAALLRRAIDRSGLADSRYAIEVLVREPSTVVRWLNESTPMPENVENWLRARVGDDAPGSIGAVQAAATEVRAALAALDAEIATFRLTHPEGSTEAALAPAGA